MVLGVIDEGTASAPLPGHGDRPAPRALIGGHGHRRTGFAGLAHAIVDTELLGLQLGEGRGEIAGVHLLIWGFLVAHDPSVRGAGRRADEEELVELGGLKELWAAEFLLAEDWGGFAEVDFRADVVLKEVAIEGSPDVEGVFFCEEGADDAAEGGEWGE